MSRKIVVGTDFRAQADRAIDRALLLAQQWDAEVIVAHAVEQEYGAQPDFGLLETKVRCVLPSEDAPVTIRFPEGPPHLAIAELAEEVDALLLVMGVARHKSLTSFVLGTSVDRLLRLSRMPVLVVKSRPQRRYRKIISATDFHTPSRIAAERAAEFFPELPITLVNGYHVPFEGWQKADYLKQQVREAEQGVFDDFVAGMPSELRARIEKKLVYGSAQKALMKASRELSADLVVLGTHGESGLRHATIGSTANELLQSLPIDTMVVRG